MLTQEQADKIETDFDTLTDDIIAAVPHSPQVDYVVMMLRAVESAAVTMLKQHLHWAAGQTPALDAAPNDVVGTPPVETTPID